MTEFERHARDLQLTHYPNRAMRYAARVNARKLAGAEGPGHTFHRLLGL